MEHHFDDVRLWFRKGLRTDTFARHFSRYFNSKTTAGQIRSLCDFKVLQSVNLFSFIKNICSYSCRLCMAEKIWIVNSKTKYSLINLDLEIYGPYRHKSKLHWFLDTCNWTYENGECEIGKCPIAMIKVKQAKKEVKTVEREAKKAKSTKGKKKKAIFPLYTLDQNQNNLFCHLIL